VSLSPHLRRGGEPLSHQAKAGVTPIDKPLKRERSKRTLQRRTQLSQGTTRLKVTPLGHTTAEQKARVEGISCIHCGLGAGHCHPAHVIDRGAVSVEAADDVRAVVPLCPPCHRLYDGGELDLSRDLEPVWRDAWEWAVGAVGFFPALRRITGTRWVPTGEAA
jgi:hypothetical protein